MATALSSMSVSPAARYSVSPFKVHKSPPTFRSSKLLLRHAITSFQTQSPISTKTPLRSPNGVTAATVENGQLKDDVSFSIEVLQRFIQLNLGNWTGSFHHFDCNGNLLHKISTRLAVTSYGEDELSSMIQSLYIKLPPLSPSDSEDDSEWFEYKIKETNMFTVDKYQQIGFFHKEKAFALRYQTAGMLETVIRQGVLGEDDTGEESPRNLKLPSRRPAIVCENCLYSLERDARARAFHITDPKGILDILILFLEERGSKVLVHPSLDDSKDSDRISPHIGTWKGHSITNRSGVYGSTIAEADTIAILEINEDGQLIQDNRTTSVGNDSTAIVPWTGAIANNLVTFDGGFQLTLLPGGMYMGYPSDVAKSVEESKSFHLEFCWLESPGKRQRLIRTFDMDGFAVSTTYILETKQ